MPTWVIHVRPVCAPPSPSVPPAPCVHARLVHPRPSHPRPVRPHQSRPPRPSASVKSRRAGSPCKIQQRNFECDIGHRRRVAVVASPLWCRRVASRCGAGAAPHAVHPSNFDFDIARPSNPSSQRPTQPSTSVLAMFRPFTSIPPVPSIVHVRPIGSRPFRLPRQPTSVPSVSQHTK